VAINPHLLQTKFPISNPAPEARQTLAQRVSAGINAREIESAVGATDIFLRANPEPIRMASAAKNLTPEYQPLHPRAKSPSVA